MSFFLQLARRAWSYSVAAMGTSTLAVSCGVLYFVINLWRDLGKHEWRQHWRERLITSAVIPLCVWTLVFAYQLFIGIPHKIRGKADSANLRPASVPTQGRRHGVDVPSLPSSWDRKANQPAQPEIPFAFAVEARIESPGLCSFSGFWLKYDDPRGCSLVSIDDLLFFRLTNIQSTPKTVINYTVEINNKGKWQLLRRVHLTSGYLIFPMQHGQIPQVGRTLNIPSNGDKNIFFIKHISVFDPFNYKQAGVINSSLFDSLVGGQPLTMSQTVRGWAAFQSEVLPGGVRIKITDEIGKVYTITPIVIKSSSDEDVAPHLLTVVGLTDASGCMRRESSDFDPLHSQP